MFEENRSQPPKIRITEQIAEPIKEAGSLTQELRNRPQNTAAPKRWLWAVVILVVIVAAGAVFLFVRSQQELKSAKKELESVQNDPTAKTKEANKQLIEQVGKLMILPANEEPSIATVADLSKLTGQPFFAKAELGDKVLIYQIAKKAILYRPGNNKIIELAPLNNSGEAGTPAEAPPAEAPITPPAQ